MSGRPKLAGSARGCTRVEGVYIPTERNGMVAHLYGRLGMAETGREADGTVTWAAAPGALLEAPSRITVERL